MKPHQGLSAREAIRYLEHRVGRRYRLRVRLVCALSNNHIDHFLDDLHVAHLDDGLHERARAILAGVAQERIARRRRLYEEILADGGEARRIDEARYLYLAKLIDFAIDLIGDTAIR